MIIGTGKILVIDKITHSIVYAIFQKDADKINKSLKVQNIEELMQYFGQVNVNDYMIVEHTYKVRAIVSGEFLKDKDLKLETVEWIKFLLGK